MEQPLLTFWRGSQPGLRASYFAFQVSHSRFRSSGFRFFTADGEVMGDESSPEHFIPESDRVIFLLMLCDACSA
jgi:hypothetical protein